MKPLRVLAVDDSRTMLDMLRAGLERAGFEVIEAETASRAWPSWPATAWIASSPM